LQLDREWRSDGASYPIDMRSVLAGCLILSATACAPATPPVQPAPHASLDAPASAALAHVVFLRETPGVAIRPGDANFRPVHVVDADGHLLGDLYQQTWFAADMEPGEHTFFAWHDGYLNRHDVSALEATLEAGRTYFVRAVPAHDVPWDVDLQASPAPPDSATNLRPVEMDRAAALQWSRDEAKVVRARVAAGHAKVLAGQFASLRAGDGRVADSVRRE